MDILHKIRIESPPDKVYWALTTLQGLSGWWTKWTTFEKGTGEVGSIIRFGFAEDKMDTKVEVMKLDKDKKVEWKSLDTEGEWRFKDTSFMFELKEENVEMYGNKKMTVVKFGNFGFEKADDFYTETNSRWGFFLLSLKDFLEKGKGMPVPDDIYM